MSKENLMNTYGRFDVVFEKGLGTKVYDVNGKEYLDFVSGVAVNCLGHSHPIIAKTLAEQSQQLIHVSNLYWNTKQLALAKKLADHTDHQRVFFCNSGTEAVETALKLARKYGKTNGHENKTEILYMDNSFHGRSMGALAVTGQQKYQKAFMPLMKGVTSVKFNDIEDLKSKMNENVCGIILEPVQGEGGIVPVEKSFLQEVRALCDAYDALLLFDEVQCGIGRTGELFAYQNFGVIPDVISMAKGLGGGFPIGATLATEKAASAYAPGDHGCTFGGNPLACAVGLAVLEELIDGGVIKGVTETGQYLTGKIEELKNKYEGIEGVQGMGLMLGIKLSIETKKVVNKAFEKGLLLVGAGENVVRILPPLNVTKEEIDQAIAILGEVFQEI
ncbi:MAG: aspartate aminotransferase family protein [Bacillota bacterium]